MITLLLLVAAAYITGCLVTVRGYLRAPQIDETRSEFVSPVSRSTPPRFPSSAIADGAPTGRGDVFVCRSAGRSVARHAPRLEALTPVSLRNDDRLGASEI